MNEELEEFFNEIRNYIPKISSHPITGELTHGPLIRLNGSIMAWYWHGQLMKNEKEFNCYEKLKAFI